MRRIETFSAFKINDKENFGFSPETYSRLKFGSLSAARHFGESLAQGFIHHFGNLLTDRQIVVLPSAYSHIRTASCIMKDFFVNRLNLFLFDHNCPPVEESKISRTVTYREDYGEMTAEQRYNLIKGDKFHVDKSFMDNKKLIFIDDIKITGTHERIITKMLDDFDIQNDCFMLYLAELQNDSVHPNIENYLNHFCVKGLDNLDEIIKTGDFIFNTRVVKYILNSDYNQCKVFLARQDKSFINDLFYLAIGNSYGKFLEYRKNLEYIRNIVIV